MEKLHEKQWLIGGESSGHLIWLSSTTTGDGIVAALQVVSVMQSEQKSLKALLAEYQKAPQVLINVAFDATRQSLKEASWKQLLQEADEWTQKLGGKGRVLLRKSGTEPVIRIMVEGEVSLIMSVAESLKMSVQSNIEPIGHFRMG
jgi:phosphoglucosamine mutase